METSIHRYVALKAERYDGAAYDERKFPFGYARASTIGALINVAALEALCFSIGLNAICRLVTPDTLGDLRAPRPRRLRVESRRRRGIQGSPEACWP